MLKSALLRREPQLAPLLEPGTPRRSDAAARCRAPFGDNRHAPLLLRGPPCDVQCTPRAAVVPARSRGYPQPLRGRRARRRCRADARDAAGKAVRCPRGNRPVRSTARAKDSSPGRARAAGPRADQMGADRSARLRVGRGGRSRRQGTEFTSPQKGAPSLRPGRAPRVVLTRPAPSLHRAGPGAARTTSRPTGARDRAATWPAGSRCGGRASSRCGGPRKRAAAASRPPYPGGISCECARLRALRPPP